MEERFMPRRLSLLCAGLLLLSTGGLAVAQQAGAQAKPAIEPGVFEALDKMGAYLRTLSSFEIQAHSTTDEVLLSGQKLQFDSTVHIRAEMPDRFWMEIASDRKQRQYFYDGKTFTIWGPRNQMYATAPVTGTLGEIHTRLEERFGLGLPLADLFTWGGEPGKGHPNIKEAIYVGPDHVGNVPCDHYAARQEGVDWQLWIQKGASPLPIKLVITTTDDDAQPQYVSVLDWNVAPALNAAMFTFEPPAGANKIPIVEVSDVAESK
jgi:hypothetical protein